MAYFGFPDIPGLARYIPPTGPVTGSAQAYGRLKEQMRTREEMARQFEEEQRRLRENEQNRRYESLLGLGLETGRLEDTRDRTQLAKDEFGHNVEQAQKQATDQLLERARKLAENDEYESLPVFNAQMASRLGWTAQLEPGAGAQPGQAQSPQPEPQAESGTGRAATDEGMMRQAGPLPLPGSVGAQAMVPDAGTGRSATDEGMAQAVAPAQEAPQVGQAAAEGIRAFEEIQKSAQALQQPAPVQGQAAVPVPTPAQQAQQVAKGAGDAMVSIETPKGIQSAGAGAPETRTFPEENHDFVVRDRDGNEQFRITAAERYQNRVTKFQRYVEEARPTDPLAANAWDNAARIVGPKHLPFAKAREQQTALTQYFDEQARQTQRTTIGARARAAGGGGGGGIRSEVSQYEAGQRAGEKFLKNANMWGDAGLAEQYKRLQKATRFLGSKNRTAFYATMASMGRDMAQEKGPMSNQDMDRMMGHPGIAEKLINWATQQNPTADSLPPLLRERMEEIARKSEAHVLERIEEAREEALEAFEFMPQDPSMRSGYGSVVDTQFGKIAGHETSFGAKARGGDASDEEEATKKGKADKLLKGLRERFND